MSAALSGKGREVALAALALYFDRLSAHVGNPGPDGQRSEIAGGRYHRVSVSWAVLDGRLQAVPPLPIFDIPAGVEVRVVGLWSQDGIFAGSWSVDDRLFVEAGTLELQSIEVSL